MLAGLSPARTVTDLTMVLARCNLPASLHAIVAGLAHHTGRGFSQTVVELVVAWPTPRRVHVSETANGAA